MVRGRTTAAAGLVLGHFPMSENYPVFKKYLEQALDLIEAKARKK